MGLISRVSSRTYRFPKMTSKEVKPLPTPTPVENPTTMADMPKIPENLLKKRKLNRKIRLKQQRKTAVQIAKNVATRRTPKPTNFKRLEWFVERANRREWERLRIVREARKPKTISNIDVNNLEKPSSNCEA